MKWTINADDFGKSPSINAAIVKCFEEGLINQTTIMVNMPYYEEAVALSKKHGFFDKVGLHLNLDDGEPLSSKMKKNTNFCRNGLFIDRIFLLSKNRFYLDHYDRTCLESEIKAQMAKYIESGFPLMHFDSHHFVHNNISVISSVTRVGTKMGFKSVRIMEVRTEDSVAKKIYKMILNKFLSRRFRTKSQFIQSLSNIQYDKEDVEFMTHPNIFDKKLVDTISWNPNIYRDFYEYKELLKL